MAIRLPMPERTRRPLQFRIRSTALTNDSSSRLSASRMASASSRMTACACVIGHRWFQALDFSPAFKSRSANSRTAPRPPLRADCQTATAAADLVAVLGQVAKPHLRY